jgi:hypothetical protein
MIRPTTVTDGTVAHRTRFNHALGITDQGFTSGAACLALPRDSWVIGGVQYIIRGSS